MRGKRQYKNEVIMGPGIWVILGTCLLALVVLIMDKRRKRKRYENLSVQEQLLAKVLR